MIIPPELEARLSIWRDLYRFDPETKKHIQGWSGISQFVMGAYIVRHSATDSYYIGSSDHIARRISIHRSQLSKGYHHNPHLQKLFEASKDFQYAYIATDTREEAYALEQQLMDANKGRKGYVNLTIDSKFHGKGRELTTEMLDKLKASQQTDSWKAKNRAITGSPEHSRKAKEQFSKPVIVNGTRYSSATEAAKANGVPKTTALHRLKSPSFKDWNWE